MLNSVIKKDDFEKCMEKVKKAYWPYEEPDNYLDAFKSIDEEIKKHYICNEKAEKCQYTDVSKINDLMKEGIETLIREKCSLGLYEKLENNKTIEFPFVEHFHELFFMRKWKNLYKHPHEHLKDLFNLEYSENHGNFNHFLNVVGALAHLINFFSNKDKFEAIFQHILTEKGELDEYTKILKYKRDGTDVEPNQRTFQLMLAGFYHDIGKKIAYHRHAMEGYAILSSYKAEELCNLKKLGDVYGYKLNRGSLEWITKMIYYHDIFGTLSTGENGYLKLEDMIEKIENCSQNKNKEATIKSGMLNIFDLWLLNVADILVARKDKYKKQDWQDTKIGEKENEIKEFFGVFSVPTTKINYEKQMSQGKNLLHDLKITIELFKVYTERNFDEINISSFEKTGYVNSNHYITLRIRRLIKSVLFPTVDNYLKEIENYKGRKEKKEQLRRFYEGIISLDDCSIDLSIEKAIKSISNFSEFREKFSWVCQLDYALSFFNKISKRAIFQVKNQILAEKDAIDTGWISKYKKVEDDEERECLDEVDSQRFMANYIIIVVMLLNNLLQKNKCSKNIVNFEFEDAGNRLTDEKIDKILFFEGPKRGFKYTALILETIFTY